MIRRFLRWFGGITSSFSRMARSFAVIAIILSVAILACTALPYPFESNSGANPNPSEINWALYVEIRLLYVAFIALVWGGGALVAFVLKAFILTSLGQRVVNAGNSELRATLFNLTAEEKEELKRCRGALMASVFVLPTFGFFVIACGAYMSFGRIVIAAAIGAVLMFLAFVIAAVLLSREIGICAKSDYALANGLRVADLKKGSYVLRLLEWD